jgi:hydroxymethylbilane synthase
MLRKVEDRRSRGEVLAERALTERIEGGCRFPLGAVAVSRDKELTLHASVFSADGEKHIMTRRTGRASEPEKLGRAVADLLVKQGALEMAQGWRAAVQEWNSRL